MMSASTFLYQNDDSSIENDDSSIENDDVRDRLADPLPDGDEKATPKSKRAGKSLKKRR